MSDMKSCAKALIYGIMALFLGVSTIAAQNKPNPLEAGFENPPESARPRVWWHWMNGNITKVGIKLDLEWMHSIGLGGFQTFDAALSTPQVVKKRLVYMTPEWKDAFKYATTLAEKYGLEEAIAGSPGWSETGGPWVKPSQGMKKYVWSKTYVTGGKPFTGRLVHPPANTGAFQNLPVRDMLRRPKGAKEIPQFYADSVVVAYRRPATDVPFESLHPQITSSGGSLDAAMLTDGNLEETTGVSIPPVGKEAWIQYEYPRPTTLRSITIVTKNPNRFAAALAHISPPEEALEASNDGQHFRLVAKLPDGGAPEQTISFPAVTARFFRVTFKRTPPPPLPAWASGLDPSSLGFRLGPPPTEYQVAELVLRPGARVSHFEEKAAFTTVPDLYEFATPPFKPDDVVRSSDFINLTSKMRPDGTLDWTPPPGNWVVLRFGYSLLGITNHPATAEATGLEVDKLNGADVRSYMNAYLDSYKNTVGPGLMGRRGIEYVITDSWEAGSQNWTGDMVAQFKKRRGYDPVPWMPVLAGEIVQSSQASDRFLWDFRKTIADLIADEHYGTVEAVLKSRGMGHYGESHESGRAFVGDGMEVKKLDDVPMGAMWTQRPYVNKIQYGYNADDRESASVAHIYGQNIAAAESMTAAAAPWAWSPETLKPTADQELLNGINRFVIHESAHQPLVNEKPGLTLGPFGQWFNRNETWANEAGPWVTYLARCSYLLQQGHFGADLVYFYGEDSNLTAIYAHKSPKVPAGYGFDYINADGLIHELSVTSGRITTPSGMSYRVLGLAPYSRHMSLPVLSAIDRLVEAGAIVAGPKPTDDPSLADNQADFHRLADKMFGNGTGVHNVGKGKVYAGEQLGEVFSSLGVAPDFDHTKPESDTKLLFAHRKLPNGDLYFVDNRNNRNEHVEATFRVAGKAPELWHPDTGRIEPVSFKMTPGRTTVPLNLGPWGTVFVVFRKPTHATSRTLPEKVRTQLATVNGSWKVSFPPNLGAPPSIAINSLSSWSDNPNSGVKYFSGTGTYTKSIIVPDAWLKPGARLWINLGDVRNLAAVSVNGKSLGIVWHTPYQVDATEALKPGANELTIKVTNAWVNRLIGDQQPGATKYTFADVKPYRSTSSLLPSGLLGPVRIYSVSSR
jgi:(4-O-methyl)-D-glucuronate---lignin esterase